VGSGGANGNKENTFAVLTAYEVVRGAGGIITGLNQLLESLDIAAAQHLVVKLPYSS
jgi:hypothetical protein